MSQLLEAETAAEALAAEEESLQAQRQRLVEALDTVTAKNKLTRAENARVEDDLMLMMARRDAALKRLCRAKSHIMELSSTQSTLQRRVEHAQQSYDELTGRLAETKSRLTTVQEEYERTVSEARELDASQGSGSESQQDMLRQEREILKRVEEVRGQVDQEEVKLESANAQYKQAQQQLQTTRLQYESQTDSVAQLRLRLRKAQEEEAAMQRRVGEVQALTTEAHEGLATALAGLKQLRDELKGGLASEETELRAALREADRCAEQRTAEGPASDAAAAISSAMNKLAEALKSFQTHQAQSAQQGDAQHAAAVEEAQTALNRERQATSQVRADLAAAQAKIAELQATIKRQQVDLSQAELDARQAQAAQQQTQQQLEQAETMHEKELARIGRERDELMQQLQEARNRPSPTAAADTPGTAAMASSTVQGDGNGPSISPRPTASSRSPRAPAASQSGPVYVSSTDEPRDPQAEYAVWIKLVSAADEAADTKAKWAAALLRVYMDEVVFSLPLDSPTDPGLTNGALRRMRRWLTSQGLPGTVAKSTAVEELGLQSMEYVALRSQTVADVQLTGSQALRRTSFFKKLLHKSSSDQPCSTCEVLAVQLISEGHAGADGGDSLQVMVCSDEDKRLANLLSQLQRALLDAHRQGQPTAVRSQLSARSINRSASMGSPERPSMVEAGRSSTAGGHSPIQEFAGARAEGATSTGNAIPDDMHQSGSPTGSPGRISGDAAQGDMEGTADLRTPAASGSPGRMQGTQEPAVFKPVPTSAASHGFTTPPTGATADVAQPPAVARTGYGSIAQAGGGMEAASAEATEASPPPPQAATRGSALSDFDWGVLRNEDPVDVPPEALEAIWQSLWGIVSQFPPEQTELPTYRYAFLPIHHTSIHLQICHITVPNHCVCLGCHTAWPGLVLSVSQGASARCLPVDWRGAESKGLACMVPRSD